MEELINVCVNNGLGVGSFVALIVFIFKYQTKANDTLSKINDSQIAMTTTLFDLSNRVTNIESEIRGK
mgnify:CR=1 FL=1